MPILSIRSEGGVFVGDLVVWAQEHLIRAGDTVAIDGSFGAQTQVAVEQFQLAHGLPVTGLVDLATWQALLRYRPVNVTWVRRSGKTIATSSRASLAVVIRSAALTLPVPASARLPARRYEIPRHLGAGDWPPR
jgi:peptidoglycan hydrolase-like protein with peptidoglycan-binding domain